MTYVVDWNNICLVCLQKGDNLCVFQKDEDSNLSVADKIMKCSNFIITKSNEQPNSICLPCLNDLNIAYKFRQNCEQSNSIINGILSQEHLKLEISGLRIKIPLGLKVTKKVPTPPPPPTEEEVPVEQEEIKDEDYDIKYSDECEEFDANDYMEGAEILDDIEEEDEKEEYTTEETENLELISELNELEQDLDDKSNIPKKRGRGRPKKQDRPSSDSKKDEKDSTKGSPRRGFSKKHKGPPEAKPPKICEICGNSYKFQHALNSHMRRHRNERPFNCDFCDKAFVSAVELRRHMRVHTGQKPYECSFCERRFSDYGSRIKHERTHTGERPYACVTCGKSFAYAHVLTVHMRTHTGEKKFICTECGRGFTKKLYLENHMTHHLTGTLRKRNPTLEEVIRKCEEVKPNDAIAYSRGEYDDGNLIESYVSDPSKMNIQPKEEEQCDEPNSHESDLYPLHHVQ
ncbi:zinc finger protein 3 homolog [Episyrphus balteatus]|uniref:zinc finger protein 3 homolog n=1 Tax=Episyrphus balteatus TaxID=286459 RepID=UPI002486C796|nr:zinc finger protein 3 homolog [Episyrphus balteatus]